MQFSTVMSESPARPPKESPHSPHLRGQTSRRPQHPLHSPECQCSGAGGTTGGWAGSGRPPCPPPRRLMLPVRCCGTTGLTMNHSTVGSWGWSRTAGVDGAACQPSSSQPPAWPSEATEDGVPERLSRGPLQRNLVGAPMEVVPDHTPQTTDRASPPPPGI
ncbi:unnamed protein product [Boreogadus saida]